jgi:superfamily II DNA or RNA helicase
VVALEELTKDAAVSGLVPGGVAKVVSVEWYGGQAAKITYEDSAGHVGQQLLYRSDEPRLELVSRGRDWSFDADGRELRLVSEALRIRLAYLFDPFLAIHTSRIAPLPHQIDAVYGAMLPRHPLRFLLADDPGAGKTIMAGLLIKELSIRGDLDRCLIVAPGSLVEQWQDELAQKFGLAFDILTRDQIEAARTGNPFAERAHLIARLDMLSRSEELQRLLRYAPEWDLVVCDEAHRMAASFFGNELKYTKRYQLGQMLGAHCRHLLLMSATPHNGHEADFQLFMALLDSDRFEGRFRDGVHKSDTSDMMRRLTKEELLTFEGRPLFPERRAYTAQYELSDAEAALYRDVTTYVREEMNRAERFASEDEKRRNNVGFALQILQRRLASSPAAIHESLRRRKERLEARLAETRLLARGADARIRPDLTAEPDIDPNDLEEATGSELEAAEEQVLDRATAARTIAELETEILTLQRLEAEARALRQSGTDTKWRELNAILDHPLMADPAGNRRKLIVFTEPRDTLDYLATKIRTRLGRHEAVVVIHGGVGREDRRKAIEAFKPLLQLYFVRKNLLDGLDWGAGETAPVDAIASALQQLPPDSQQEVLIEFREMSDLAGPGFTNGVLNEAQYHGDAGVREHFAALKSHLAKAVWTVLERPNLIANATLLRNIDKLPPGAWIKRTQMPSRPGPVDRSVIQELQDALIAFFTQKQLRGKNCKIDCLQRGDEEIFYAYPEDHPDTLMVWDEGQLVPRVQCPVFDLIFKHNDERRVLDIYCEGDRTLVPKLQVLFARAVLKEEISEEAPDEGQVYDLAKLTRPDFEFRYSDELGIARVRLTKIRFTVEGEPWRRFTAEADTAKYPDALNDFVAALTANLPKSRLFPDQACINVTFQRRSGDRTAPSRTFYITYPNSVRLKKDDLGQRIEEMLVQSGIEVRSAPEPE